MKKYKLWERIKRTAAIVLIVMLSIPVLSGCRKDNVNITIEEGDLDASQSYFSKHYVSKGESGYYFLGGRSGRYIMYFDTVTNQTIPLCSKAECKHDSAECAAYVDGTIVYSYIFFYNGKLYWFINEGGMLTAIEGEQDGSNQKRVAALCTYSDNTTFECVFVNDYIYFTENGGNEISDEDKTVKLKRMSLTDKKIEDVYEYTGKNAVIQNLKAYSNDVYSLITAVEETGEKTCKRSGKGLYISNANSNETKKVIDDSVSDFCLDTKNKYLYYYVYSDGLYRVKDNNKENILKATEQTGFCNLTFDGNYVYMDNEYWAFYSSYFMAQDYNIKKMIWIYDNGQLMTSIDIKEAGMISAGNNGDTEYFFGTVSGLGDACF